ncbi:WecB/TagA/CpsF family glycosyltransferase [Candidatus Woesebacteria bacterium]|nr:WecB/TagA/CpsF family glycosyltransferase [Candidatus Woesebacteria bacterium]
MNQLGLHTTTVFGFSIVTDRFGEVAAAITRPHDTTLLICTPNPEQLVLAEKNKDFAADLRAADVLLPDGAGLVVASRVLAGWGKCVPITERITGIDMVTYLLGVARNKQQRVLVIGGRGYERFFKESVEELGDITWMEGYKDVSAPNAAEEAAVVAQIEQVRPTLVFVALGAPAQEQWLVSHTEILEKNAVQVAMAVGGTFDIISGKLQRAPAILRQLHLEWLYRLFQEPWRFKRQLQLLHFIRMTVSELV